MAEHRFAICNEVFGKLSFREACRRARALGYEGIEIAPFTLADDATSLSSAERQQFCRTMVEQGLEFVGLHWLLTSPAGLHATARDEAVRRRTWEYIGRLIDLCADLSGCRSERNGVMVFGSPKQRSTADGMSVKEAVDIFTHEIAHLAPHAECCGVTILVEALPSDQTDVINHLSEAVAIVRQICSPAVQTMFDTHNTADETEPHPELLKRYFSHIRHVHVNEMNGQEPGMGDYDFATLLKTLSELHYSGWISVEAFDFSRDPDEIAKRAIDHLKTAARGSESFIKV